MNGVSSYFVNHGLVKSNPKASAGDRIQHYGELAGNQMKTDLQLGGIALGTAATAAMLPRNSEAVKNYLTSKSPKLGKGFEVVLAKKDAVAGKISTIASQAKEGLAKEGSVFSKIAGKVKGSKLLSKLPGKEKIAGALSTVAKGLSKVPGPLKALAAVLGAGVLVNHSYNAGKIDQKFDDKVAINSHFLG